MKRVKILTIVAIFFLTACGGDGAKENKTNKIATSAKRDCNLTMGWEPRAPYQFSRNGEITGIDVTILQQAANKVNCDVSFVEGNWTELLTKLEEGDIDVLAGATITDERAAYANFSTPYRDESFTLFIRAGNSYDGNTLSGFLSRSQKIGVTRDYFYGEQVYALMNHPQYSNLFINSKSGKQSFFNILYSQIDGVLADPIEGNYIIKHNSLSSKIKASSVQIPSASVAYMFSKKTIKDKQLKDLQTAIKSMVNNNQIQPVIAKY